MTTGELKLSLFKLLEEENDPKILETIREVVLSIMKLRKKTGSSQGETSDKIVIHTGDGVPLTKKQMGQLVSDAYNDVKSGKFVRQEELDKEVENW